MPSVSLTLVLFGSLLVVPSAGARVKPRDSVAEIALSVKPDLENVADSVAEPDLDSLSEKYLQKFVDSYAETDPDSDADSVAGAVEPDLEGVVEPAVSEVVPNKFGCYPWAEAITPKEQCDIHNYYQDVDVTSVQALHEKIQGQRALLYSATTSQNPNPERGVFCSDVWKALEFLDESKEACGPHQPCSSNATLNVDLLYSKHPVEKTSRLGGGGLWNREHVWPKSYGVSCKVKKKMWKRHKGKWKCKKMKKYVEGNGPFTDVHHLFPSHAGVNSDRSSQYFEQCTPGACNYEHHAEDGYTAADEDAGESKDDRTFWQPPRKSRGVVARSLFYMALRYNGEEESTYSLTLTDYPSYCNDALGKLSSLIKWHKEFPPTEAEKERNAKACFVQGNRNPFVDHPELVEEFFGAETPNPLLVKPRMPSCKHNSPRAHKCDEDADYEDLCFPETKPVD